MTILLHSSKTMRIVKEHTIPLTRPLLLSRAEKLAAYLKTLSSHELATCMHISSTLAEKTHTMLKNWTAENRNQSLALDCFIGDIYSGLHAEDLSREDRDYANEVLVILSGLYGCIRPYDGIFPYRLEMGYTLPEPSFSNLYSYWGDNIAACLPKTGVIANLSAEEYTKAVLPFVDNKRVIEPKFLTMNSKTGEPTFVVVHTKIARGAFARWLIVNKIKEISDFSAFTELGYLFDKKLSTEKQPVFVCKEFEGKGLSIRLSKKQ